MELAKKLTLIALAVFIVGCNEKVAPELKNGGVTSDGSGDGSTEVPEEYYLKVKDTSPDILGYKLHRTGAGNYNKECKVSSKNVALSNALYTAEGNASPAIDHDSKNYDITCYYDMEELALYANGFSFEIESSKNTCEYLAYSPFSFYDRQPGSSTATITRVKCEGTGSVDLSPTGLNVPQAADSTGTYANCGQIVETTGKARSAGLARVREDPEDDGLCNFDYTSQNAEGIEPGQNCDVGTININTYTFTYDPSTGSTAQTVSTSEIKCGGKISNCIQGPHKQEFDGGTIGTVYIKPATNEGMKKEFKYEDLLEKERSSTTYYSNFRSNLANPDLDFMSYSSESGSGGNPAVWTTSSDRKRFNPKVMESYAANRYYGTTTPVVTKAAHLTEASKNFYTRIPFAADPFMGLTVGNVTGIAKTSFVAPITNGVDAEGDSLLISFRTQPFYTVHCLDAARDVKARIRIVVRDWDRSFSNTSALENISDYIGSTTPNLVSRQDNPYDQEINGDNDIHNNFNDYYDWDNKIPMVRTTGPTVVGTTFWQPETGFFSIENFTNGYF